MSELLVNLAPKTLSWQDLSLSPTLFWDTDASKIGLDTHAKTVIERVILRGTWSEFKAIIGYYGKEKIKEILIKLRYLDCRTLSFCSVYFHTPITEFRCYTLKQSNPTHWNY
jgi:hypothetical protein